jgi:thymidylate synthase ThyX
MWHTVICTGSEWENFFALRANDQAEIHIQDLAFKMLEAYNASEPKQLKAGEWHIPFGDSV